MLLTQKSGRVKVQGEERLPYVTHWVSREGMNLDPRGQNFIL